MKLGQLIQYNMRNILIILEKLYLKNYTQNVVDKLFPSNFLKNQR